MNAQHIEELLRELGSEKIKQGGTGWITATCPAAFSHSKGRDSTPSFGVLIEPSGSSYCHCFTCGISLSLTYLIFFIGYRTKRDLSKALGIVQKYDAPSVADLETRERLGAEASKRSALKEDNGKYWGWREAPKERPVPIVETTIAPPEIKPLPESTLSLIEPLPDDIEDYLVITRKLKRATVKAWELGWHSGARRISIPVRDCEKVLVGISGRAISKETKPKFLHSAGFRSAFYLFGENKAVRGQRVHLVEGFFDVMYLWQKGYNAVAMNGSNLSGYQITKLKQMFTEVIIVPDGDTPGYEAADKALLALGPVMPVRVTEVPEGKDPDELTDEELSRLLGDPQFNSVE